MSGGLPAAMRVRTSGMKSRADVYFTSMPVAFVNAAVTFRNAACSLPPHSESTSIEPAWRFVGFALIAVAVNPAARTTSATADAISDFRRFNSILLLFSPPCLPGWYLQESWLFGWGREVQLRLRIEDVELLHRYGELHLLARLHLLFRRDQGDDLVSLGLGVDEL